MFMKTIAAAAAIAIFASSASAVTQLTSADALENGGSVIDLMSDDGFQFDEDFADGASGPLSFEFLNTGAGATTIVVSSASIRQQPGLNFFTGGASVSWVGAGVVAAAAQNEGASGHLSFTLASGASDTLVLDFGAAVSKVGEPNIDFFVSTVPLPAGVLLMGTALAGFGVAARRKKKAA